ncbi:MAG TPA: MmgE/PrpD family protein, partial [Noviherbaspirillum sp.]
MTVAQTLAHFGSSLCNAPLDPDVVHHAKRAIVDWYAALLPGAVESPAVLLEQALQEDLDRGDVRLALGRAATLRTAALINGTAAHTVEVDDIYREAIFHPGAPTIAAALAVAQARQATGMQLIRGVIAGYEISTRIGAALGRMHYRYWHSTGTVGTFGAIAAAATLLNLDPKRYAHALCTGATFAAGLQQAFRMDSMSKPLHAGHAAEAGVLSALAAQRGVTGSLDVLDGEAGMGRAMSEAPDWEAAVATLGQVFHITRMTFKNHACCGHTFAPIDGALELRARTGLRWQDLQAIEVATYGPALEVAGNTDPKTAAEARFSIPFVVATALIHGSVRLSAFTPERMADADIR